MEHYFFSKGEIIFSEGSKGTTFWVILSGSVKITKRVLLPVAE